MNDVRQIYNSLLEKNDKKKKSCTKVANGSENPKHMKVGKFGRATQYKSGNNLFLFNFHE